MNEYFSSLSSAEKKIFRRLNTSQKIQDFLETIPQNFERKGHTIMSPRIVLQKKTAHCFEGALLAAAVFWYHGGEPLLLDLKTGNDDDDHVVALFRHKEKWGAISKTNHAVLRYRDAVYESPRELALSYFHEYFLDTGKKTLESFSVFDLRTVKHNWLIDEKNLFSIDTAIEKAKHTSIVDGQNRKHLRKADAIERKMGKSVVWKR